MSGERERAGWEEEPRCWVDMGWRVEDIHPKTFSKSGSPGSLDSDNLSENAKTISLSPCFLTI